MRKNLLKLGIAAVLVFGTYSVANASAILRISDGTSTVYWDGTTYSTTGTAIGTKFSLSGALGWTGSLGVWDVVVDTGYINGTAVNPSLDLSFSEHSTAAGNLTVSWTGTGFGPSSGGFVTSIGGTMSAGDGVSFATFYSPLNSDPAGLALTGIQNFSTLSFSADGSASVGPLNSPYSLTEVLTISHGGADSSSGDAALTAVPDGGSTLMLLGAAMSVLGVYSRSRCKQQA